MLVEAVKSFCCNRLPTKAVGSPSPILLGMGYSAAEAIKGIRLSCDCRITQEDLEWTVMVMEQIADRFTSSVKIKID